MIERTISKKFAASVSRIDYYNCLSNTIRDSILHFVALRQHYPQDDIEWGNENWHEIHKNQLSELEKITKKCCSSWTFDRACRSGVNVSTFWPSWSYSWISAMKRKLRESIFLICSRKKTPPRKIRQNPRKMDFTVTNRERKRKIMAINRYIINSNLKIWLLR